MKHQVGYNHILHIYGGVVLTDLALEQPVFALGIPRIV